MAQSRRQRWESAVAEGKEALQTMEVAADELKLALENLNDLRTEYEEWYDNMPEQLQGSATGEKLQEITNLDFDVEIDLEDYNSILDEAEGADLPSGFGRD